MKIFRPIAVLLFALCSACASITTVELPISSGVRAAVEDFAASLKLEASAKPWIRGYNRWANTQVPNVTRSWEGGQGRGNLMLVELLSGDSCTVVFDAAYGRGDSQSIAKSFVLSLGESGTRASIRQQSFFSFN